MAKKIGNFMDKLVNYFFDVFCITCLVFGVIAVFYALMDIFFFEGFINAFRRRFWEYMGFAALIGFGIPISKIFWKRYLRKIRQEEIRKRIRRVAAKLREEAENV